MNDPRRPYHKTYEVEYDREAGEKHQQERHDHPSRRHLLLIRRVSARFCGDAAALLRRKLQVSPQKVVMEVSEIRLLLPERFAEKRPQRVGAHERVAAEQPDDLPLDAVQIEVTVLRAAVLQLLVGDPPAVCYTVEGAEKLVCDPPAAAVLLLGDAAGKSPARGQRTLHLLRRLKCSVHHQLDKWVNTVLQDRRPAGKPTARRIHAVRHDVGQPTSLALALSK